MDNTYSVLDRLGQVYCEILDHPEKWHPSLGRPPAGYDTMTEQERINTSVYYMRMIEYMIERPSTTLINWYRFECDSTADYISLVCMFPGELYPELKKEMKSPLWKKLLRSFWKIAGKLKTKKREAQE